MLASLIVCHILSFKNLCIKLNNPSRVVSYTIDTFVYGVTFLWVVIN